MKRVVVTGIGMVTPLGNDVSSSWQALVSGQSGIAPITRFDTDGFQTSIAAEVSGFEPTDYVSKKEARTTDPFIQFAIAASAQAVENADLKISSSNATRIATLIGSGLGGVATMERESESLFNKGPRRVSPFLVPMMVADMAAGKVSIHLGTKGPAICITSSCCSGSDSIGEAAEMIKRGDVDIAIAGGAEATITRLGISGFSAAGALSRRNSEPQLASRPFDAERDGFVMGEGGAVLVLESLEHAEQRGAKIVGEIAGFGFTADAHHITQPSEGGEGGVRSMRLAMENANLRPDEIDYINAHGTSTPYNDRSETQAIKTAFGEASDRVVVSSSKSMTGHLLGAGGAMEAAFCILAIRDGIVPPTINLENPDPDCDLDYVPHVAREMRVRTALSNSFGFGGHNTALIFKEFA